MPQPTTIHYFAIFREQAGLSTEAYEGTAATLGELYRELAGRHEFTLPADQVRVAVGTEYVPMDTPLTEGMDITFIPPVAGG